MPKFKPNPHCGYCRGDGKVHHVQPPGLSDGRWFQLQGFGHCPLCAGYQMADRARMSDTNEHRAILFVKLAGGAALCSCPQCDLWVPATKFFNGPPETVVEAQCPNLHVMRMEVQR